MRRYTFRASFLLSGLLALLALAPAAHANEVSSLPAAGDLSWPAVAARTRPDPRARTVRVLYQFRDDFRRQIVLAIGKRRVGVVKATAARVTLKNEAGADALKLTARKVGALGDSITVTVADGDPSTTDNLVINRLAYNHSDGDLQALAATVNADPQSPVTATAIPGAAGPLVKANGVRLAGGRDGKPGRLWYRLNLPIRPFGTTGWVPAESVFVKRTTHRIVVRRRARSLAVFRGGRRVFRTRVAVGRPDRPTPVGNFYVAAKFRPPRTSLVSTYALELSAPAGLSDFPGGGVVGIHGTPALWSIGKNVSNGCVRVRPAAALRLKRIVPLGTPVAVRR